MSKSSSTNSKYLSYFKKWEDYISSKGGSAIPALPIHICLYLTELMDKSAPCSIVISTIYSIKWAHSLKNLPDPTNNMFVNNLVEAAKRTLSKPVQKKDPITTDMLITLCTKYEDSRDILVVRDLCMILVAFSAFLRYDELSNLRCNDIIMHDEYFSISIKKSKTDQYRHGNVVVVAKGGSLACPYALLNRYLRIIGCTVQNDTFLFKPCFRSGTKCKQIYKDKALSYTRARETVVSRLKEVTGDLNIGLHSLRAGGATMAANAGVNDRCWKRHGRCKGGE